MAAGYILGLIFVLGFVQGNPVPVSPAIIEDLRNGSPSRVVLGWPAYDTQIPYQVSLRMINNVGGVSSCGGSIIHHEWVITAAHCLANRNTFVVRLGLTNLTRPEYMVESSKKFIHPDYDEIRAGVQTDDIALLGLDNYISYGATIQPARLQSSEQKDINYAGKRLVVSGYGRTDDLWNGGAASEILRWTFLLGITNEDCLGWYVNSTVVAERTICTVHYNDTYQSSCQGDSGGPLTIVDADGETTMVGVVSFGSTAGCNTPWPSGYVRPGYYHDWYYEVTGIDFDWKAEQSESITDYDGVDQVQVVD